MNWYLKCWQQYADFGGRARRKEYWMFVLFNAIIGWVVGFVFGLMGIGFVAYAYTLAVFIPSLAVGIRRLHDIGKSGWWFLLALLPVIGTIWLIVLFCMDSQPDSNQWGNNPKESETI